MATQRTLMRLAFEDAEQDDALSALGEAAQDGLVPVSEEDLQGAHDDSEKIDELISTTRTVESIAQAVQSAGEQDGLGRATAQALDVAFEHFKLRAGIAVEKTLSLEGFGGGRSSRLVATRVALEDMGETVRRLIKKLIAWIKHIALVCYDLIERIMRGANAVIERAQTLYKAASAMSYRKFDKDKLEPVEQSGLVAFFNKNGRPMDCHEIIHRFQDFSREMNAVFNGGKLFQPAVRGLSELERFVHGQGEKDVDLGAVEGFAEAACAEIENNSLRSFSARQQSDADILTYELPFGNSELVFSFVKGVIHEDKRVGFNASIETNPVDKAAALTPLKPQEVMNLMTVLTAEMSKGIYRESKKIKAAIYDVEKRVERQSNQLSDAQRKMGASVVPTLHLIKTLSDSSMKLTRLLYSYTGTTTRRILSYAEASLKVYHGAAIS